MSQDQYKDALNKLIDAWEALKGGRNHSGEAVEDWLHEHTWAQRSTGRVRFWEGLPNER